jgi:endonuclease YncB( thermonuclease family)
MVMRRILSLVMLVALLAAPPALAAQKRLAFVQPDGTLKVGQRIVRLYGIYIPPGNRICKFNVRPVRCGSRSVVALDLRVDRFATCNKVSRNRDRSVNAVCRIRDRNDPLGPDVDLSAWMVYHGWAVALPGAPFTYYTLERIAKAHRRGIWGFQVDSITAR